MRASERICLQLAVLSITSAAWGQQLRSSTISTQQHFPQAQIPIHHQLQQTDDISPPIQRLNTVTAHTNFPQPIESQQQFQTSGQRTVQGSNSAALQEDFRDAVSLAVRERVKISQLEAQNAQRQGFQNINSQDQQVANFQTHTPQRSPPTPLRQQPLATNLLQQQKSQGQVFSASPLVQQRLAAPSAAPSHTPPAQQQILNPQFQAASVQQRSQTISTDPQQAAVPPPVQPFQHAAPGPQQHGASPPIPAAPRPKSLPPAPDRRVPLQQREQQDITTDALFKHQAENAKYSFDSVVTDGIMDNSHIRQEVRDGLNVQGLYSYSDGFFKRTVHYEADQNGYRVVKEETEPIGNGPQVDLAGTADVATNVGGINSKYTITAADIPRLQQGEVNLG